MLEPIAMSQLRDKLEHSSATASCNTKVALVCAVAGGVILVLGIYLTSQRGLSAGLLAIEFVGVVALAGSLTIAGAFFHHYKQVEKLREQAEEFSRVDAPENTGEAGEKEGISGGKRQPLW